MIRFRQKNFVGWMIPTMIGTTGLTMWQTHSQGKEQEKQSEETQKALDRQTKALNKIAKEAKNNPEIAQSVVQQKQMSDTRIKLFAAPSPGLVKNVTGFAKDLWKTQKKNVMKTGKVGLGFGAMTYAGNRITTSLKDHDEGNDKKNLGFLGKAALAGTTIGGTYLAAKHGMLGKTPIKSTIKSLDGKSVSGVVQKGMEKVGRAVNPIQRTKEGNVDKLPTALNTVFVGMPVVGYLGQRKQIKDQAKQTEKSYSEGEKNKTGKKLLKIGAGVLGTAGTLMAAKHGILGGRAQRFAGNVIANTGGLMRSAGLKSGDKVARSGAQTYAKGVARKGPISELDLKLAEDKKFRQVTSPARTSGGVNKAASFIGFYGKGGTNSVQHTADALASSNNVISKNVGTFMQNHKTAANLMAGGGALAVGSSIMSAGNIPYKVFDKHAYDYEKEQNKQVE